LRLKFPHLLRLLFAVALQSGLNALLNNAKPLKLLCRACGNLLCRAVALFIGGAFE
jgi:hypothetical protein